MSAPKNPSLAEWQRRYDEWLSAAPPAPADAGIPATPADAVQSRVVLHENCGPLGTITAYKLAAPADAGQAQALEDAELPPLPKAVPRQEFPRYTADQMRDYARACMTLRQTAQCAAPDERASIDTPNFQQYAEYWRKEPYGTRSFENAWAELVRHINLWGHGRYIRGYDKRKAEEAAPPAPAAQPEAKAAQQGQSK